MTKSKAPVLRDIRKTIKVSLPSFPGSKVILWNGLLTWQNEALQEAKTPYQAGIITLKYLIKEWNFVDEDDKPVPVDDKSLGSLPSKDVTFLVSKTTEAVIQLQTKKKVSSKKLLNHLSQIK